MVLEALGRFPEAIRDYKAVLAVAPDDPAAWNNLGNANAGSGDWAAAAEYYGRAAQLAPAFSFAQANRALALYQLGQDNKSIKEMRCGAVKRYRQSRYYTLGGQYLSGWSPFLHSWSVSAGMWLHARLVDSIVLFNSGSAVLGALH